MREAANIAGIPNSRLILALEPEAASVYCKNLPVDRTVCSERKSVLEVFSPGTKYLILDAGGGTIDITVQEIKPDGNIKQIYMANGDDWGGVKVDLAFEEFLTDIVGMETMEVFREEDKLEYLSLCREFEMKKRDICPDSKAKCTIRVPVCLIERLQDVKGMSLKEVSSSNKSIVWVGDKLRLDAETAKSFFTEASRQIIDHISGIFEESAVVGTEAIVMVGDFSESPMLQEAIKTAFPNMTVIIPNEAGVAVLKGAVQFGFNPQVISPRIGRFTYGVSDEDESSHSNDVIATTADETAHVDVVPLAAEDDDTLHLRLDTTEENVSAQTESGVNEGLEHLQMLLGDNKELTVRRQSILTDVIQAYADPQLVGQRLVIRFEGELGQDAGGLTKDFFSAFWDAAFKTYFVGERCCVPFLPIHRFSESSIFPILGRILTHGTALTGVFPIRLCRSSVFSIIHGTPCEDEEMLLSDLLMYLTDFERQVSKTALEDFNKLTPRMINHLTDMFIRFGVSILPKADTFRQLMVNLARSEIAIKPLFLCTQIRQGIPSLHMDSFWSILTTSDLKTLYQNLNPTPQTVVDKLQSDKEDLRPQEANTLYYLKDFVYSLNSDDLVLFLVFITGSDVLPRDDIIVTFNTRSGMLRVPVAHTCGNTLELSTTYETIQDFKREFLLVLHSQEAFQMSIA